MINADESTEPYVKFYNADDNSDDGGESFSEQKKTKTTENNCDLVDVHKKNSNSLEILNEKHPILALRFLLAFTIWLGLFVVHGGRFFSYIAISTHHIQPYLREMYSYNQNSTKWDNENMTEETSKYDNENMTEETSNYEESKYNSYGYNVRLTGYYSIFAFMCGYAVSGIPGGYLSHIYPPTRIFFFAVTISSFINVFYPLLIHSFGCLLTAHIFQGLAEGMILPAFFGVWTQWSQPKERNNVVLISLTGMLFGMLVGSEFIRQLLDQWMTGYYLFGLLALFWAILWICVFTVPIIPQSNFQQEPIKILNSICICVRKHSKPVPWKEILSSKPVWAIVMATACHRTYFTFVFHPEMSYHAIISYFLHDNVSDSRLLKIFTQILFLPFSLSIIMLFLLVLLNWYLEVRRNVPVIHIRKVFTCLGLALQIPSIFLIVYFFLPWVNIIGFVLPLMGYFLNPFDISPKYAPILVGISNTFANFLMIFVAIIWLIQFTFLGGIALAITVLVVLALFLIATCIFYAIFSTAEKQPWAD